MIKKYIEELKNDIENINLELQNADDYKKELEDTLKVAIKFKELEEELQGFEITKSPYGNSFYLVPKGKKVGWGNKPEGSYRFSNHWNWGDVNEYTGEKNIHCPTNTGEDFNIAIAIYKEGLYYEI